MKKKKKRKKTNIYRCTRVESYSWIGKTETVAEQKVVRIGSQSLKSFRTNGRDCCLLRVGGNRAREEKGGGRGKPLKGAGIWAIS